MPKRIFSLFFSVFISALSLACSSAVDEREIEIYPKAGDFIAPGPAYLACEADSFVMSCGCSADAAIRTISPSKTPIGLNGCMCESIAGGTMHIEVLCLRRK